MSPDRVDQLLRRASDDVRATVVRHTVPPPIEAVADRGRRVTRSLARVAAVAVTVSLGWAIVGDRNASAPPTIEAPGPIPTAAPEATAAADGFVDLCGRVVGLAGVLADPPGDADSWAALGDELDVLETQLARSRSELDADTARRYDRFAVLTGQAVSLGEQGGFTPAGGRADDAVAVAAELVEFVAVPGCEFEPARSTDEEDPG